MSKAKTRMKTICFIDDDRKDELEPFERAFEHLYNVLIFTSFAEAQAYLATHRDVKVDLFVLDLYMPDTKTGTFPGEFSRDAKLILDQDRGEIRRAYGNLKLAEERYKAVLTANRQSPEEGLRNAEYIQSKYPKTPIVFFSRKAKSEDIVHCMMLEQVYDVIIKPFGITPAEAEAELYKKRYEIKERFETALKRSAAGDATAPSIIEVLGVAPGDSVYVDELWADKLSKSKLSKRAGVSRKQKKNHYDIIVDEINGKVVLGNKPSAPLDIRGLTQIERAMLAMVMIKVGDNISIDKMSIVVSPQYIETPTDKRYVYKTVLGKLVGKRLCNKILGRSVRGTWPVHASGWSFLWVRRDRVPGSGVLMRGLGIYPDNQ